MALVGAKGHKRRPPGSTVVTLRLRAWEAIFLAFETQPPRLSIVDPAPADLGDPLQTTFAASEEAAAAAAEAASPLDLAACWTAFLEAEPQLPVLYAAYATLRDAGWHIRDGIKFGFDFALYDATGPASKHAALGALVLTAEDEGERSWLWLQRHTRVCHSVGKGLLLCSVEEPPADDAAARGPRPPRLAVRTMRMDGWDLGREHASLSN